jgi:hypothetical protein
MDGRMRDGRGAVLPGVQPRAAGQEIHEPHDPIVDHAEERDEALARYDRIRRT